MVRNNFPKLPSGAPLHTMCKLVGFVPPPPPLILGGALLYLRSLKGGCCSISDDLSCSFSFPLFTILWPMRVNLVHIIIQFDFKRLWSEKNGRGGGGICVVAGTRCDK